ncbi:conserved protein of unknown function [Methylorubrum extorquens]|uniref:Uncharacterized protein n=1 Tax=Methylorubrum extorquens TaxID=408 RepID=A0A2N9AXT3_METEX|nr:hypothetical protein ASF33_06345 [Methylobacterium sp. Leaf92]KQQ11692.1 hypothetical protein ASF56_24720 [Methylobacterium sp. Leaf122]SOR32129.1 conserved protein of unknown function [Methylorubrum extorquens]
MGCSERRGLARLMLRHPQRRAAFRRLAADDPYFLELCEAYEAACAAVEFWAKSNDPAAPDRTCEYRVLAAEVEKDILRKAE